MILHPFARYSFDPNTPEFWSNKKKTKDALKNHVEYFEGLGFDPTRAHVQPSDLYDLLIDVRKKVNTLVYRPTDDEKRIYDNSDDNGNSSADIIKQFGSASSAFQYAASNRDLGLMESLLPRIKNEQARDSYLDVFVEACVALGSILRQIFSVKSGSI